MKFVVRVEGDLYWVCEEISYISSTEKVFSSPFANREHAQEFVDLLSKVHMKGYEDGFGDGLAEERGPYK